MAKQRIHLDNEEQEEMTVIVFRLKGKSGTLQKGFDAVTQAFSAIGIQPVIQSQRKPSPALAATPAGGNGTNDGAAEVIDGEIDDVPEDEAAERSPGRGVPRKKSKPKYLNDLNLSPEGQIGWKDYAAEKNPKTENQKHLVAAAWLTKHGGHPTFTANHIFTCFRSMKWETQEDFSQPIRQMKMANSYYENEGVPRGQWKLTTHGLDDAEAIKNNESS